MIILDIVINTVISNGAAYGKAIYLDFTSNYSENINNVEEETARFEDAKEKAIKELDSLKDKLNEEDSLFTEVHKALISDPILDAKVRELINKSCKAEKAVSDVIDEFIETFKNAKTVYLQERILDMEDIKKRIIFNMNNVNFKNIEGPFILVVEELYPSLLMTYSNQILGVIAKKGGFTSHSAIICKSREIPYVIVDDISIISDYVIIDTRHSIIKVNPNKDDIIECDNLKKRNDSFVIDDFSSFGIGLYANVGNTKDIKKVIDYNMNGVGLFRSEIIFMNMDRPMTLEEQIKVYSNACELMKGRSITIRTFDIGDDKKLSYINTYKKGIDNYINNKDIFETQIKALIMSNKYNNLRIMFPMIESHDEFIYLKDWVLRIKEELNDKGILKIGMMLETKKALECIKEFKDTDFISLGTNDLIAELYNLKRDELMNYDSYINDLLDKIEKVINHCRSNNINLSICGELASVKKVVKRLYRIGMRNFSLSTAFIRDINDALLEEIEE